MLGSDRTRRCAEGGVTTMFVVVAAIGAFVLLALAVVSARQSQEILREADETLEKAHTLLAVVAADVKAIPDRPLPELPYAAANVRHKPTKGTR